MNESQVCSRHLAKRGLLRLARRRHFYGLLDNDLDEVIEFYPSRQAAELELTEILSDEPGWVEKLEVVVVDFSELRPPS